MKTPEDEAFDELAKKQGAWGGGFQAKRAAAADKINADFDEEYKKMHEDRIKYGTSWEKDGKRIDPMSVYKEPAQEHVEALENLEQEIYENTRNFVSRNVMEWMLKRYYTTPPKRPWVGLTETEIDEWTPEIHGVIRSIEAKLKEKNNGT
jgi:hypothetical protein